MPETPFRTPPIAAGRLTPAQRWAVVIFVIAGTLIRAAYVFVLHPAVDHVYSDMEGYVHRALAYAAFGRAHESIGDSIYPPGATIYFALLNRIDPSWRIAAVVQGLVSVAITGVVWSIARRLYGNATAVIALAVTSIYLPLIHYAGLFMAENPFTLAGLGAFRMFLAAIDSGDTARANGWALLTGFTAGIAASFKGTVLAPIAVAGMVWVAFAIRQRRGGIGAIVVCACAGLVAVLLPLTQRCTDLVRTQVCFGSTNAAMNVLMGHYGETGPFHWRDDARNGRWVFESPAAVLHGYKARVDLPFPPYDEKSNLALAKRWIGEHPMSALRLSLGHVADLFTGRTLWPSAELWGIDWGAVWQWLFWLMLLPAALARVVVSLPAMVRLDPRSLPEWLLVTPIVGLAATAFLTIGEVRYRVPFDPFFIILAARTCSALRRPVGSSPFHPSRA